METSTSDCQSLKIIFLAIGSDGDINPLLEIATELKRRGQRVEFIANGHFQNKVEAEGLEFRPLGGAELYQEGLQNEDIWHPRKGFQAVWKSVYASLELGYKLIMAGVEPGRTILVGSTLAFSARIVSEVHNLPLCSVHLSPSCLISRQSPPVGPGVVVPAWLPYWLKRLYVYLVEEYIIDAACRDDLNTFRSSLGLPPIKNVFSSWVHSPDLVLCAFPEWFASRQADWPANLVFTGFPLYSKRKDEDLSDAVQDFLAAGEAPLIFTAGSAMAHSAEYFRRALDCALAGGWRAIFVTKFRDQIVSNLPPQVMATAYEPFDLLFARAKAVSHHGGIGTSAQCLRAGAPQLVAPFAHDQFDNALRLTELGVAATVGTGESGRKWSEKLRTLLQREASQAACQKYRRLMDERGAVAVAEAIMGLRSAACGIERES